MQWVALIWVALFSAMASTATLAASQEQCNDIWLKADKDADGDLSPSEVTPYLIAIKKDGRHNESAKDGKIDVDEFMAACKDGVFDGMFKN